MEYAIVDLQGFKDDFNNFIVKELCFLTQNIKFTDTIKCPYEFDSLSQRSQSITRWLINNYHGIQWDSGYISIKELRAAILPILKNKIIYVKGEEKVEWLRKILNEKNLLIVNMEMIGCDLTLHIDNSLEDKNRCKDSENEKNAAVDVEKKEFDVRCHYHRSKPLTFNCSLNNVVKLKKWYVTYCRKK